MPAYRLKKDCQIPGLGKIYLTYFGYKRDGVFVEIGAYDGDSWSNTCGLADLGWRGVYVEPVRAFYEKCRRRHADNLRVTVLNFAVGAQAGEATIHLGGPLSTISDVSKANYQRMGWWKGKGTQAVKMVTLDDVLETQGIAPLFDLLVIDVEGYEWEVVQAFDVERWQPRMVIVELHDTAPNYACIREECLHVKDFFAEHEYRPVYKDKSNTVYVRP